VGALTALVALLGPLGDFIVKLVKGFGPSPVVVEAEKAGAAQQAVSDLENTDAQAQNAAVASNSAVQLVATRGGLRQYEASDPNNRDNHGG
jgi:hypothetical protein